MSFPVSPPLSLCLLLLSLFSLFLSFVLIPSSSAVYSNGISPSCIPISDPFPLSYSHVAVSQTSSMMITTLGHEGGAVIFFPTEGITFSLSNVTYPDFMTTFILPSCSLVNGTTLSGTKVTRTVSMTFAKSLDVAQDIAAIGSPNRIQTEFFSQVEIIQWDSTHPYTSVPTMMVTFESFDVANLGLLVSLSPDGNSLASYYDPNRLVLFNNIRHRYSSVQQFNSSQGDIFLYYPSGFYPDSLSYGTDFIAVSGCILGTSSTACIPAVAIWNYVGATWNLLNSNFGDPANNMTQPTVGSVAFPATRSPTWVPSDPVNYIYTPAATYQPANLLPLKLSSDGQNLVLGVPSWQGAFYGTSIDFFTTQLLLLGYPDTVDKQAFGKAVGFIDDGGNVISIQSNGLMYIFQSAVWNLYGLVGGIAGSPGKNNPFYLAQEIIPNRLQRKTFTTPTPRYFTDMATNVNLTIGIYNSDLLAPNTELFPVPRAVSVGFIGNSTIPAGSEFSFATNQYIPCEPGRFYDPTGISGLPCQLCPVGTYSDIYGAISCKPCTTTWYCPLGSTSQINVDVTFAIPVEESSFEPEDFREAFEELLINAIFFPTTPPMIVLFVIVAVTLIILLLFLIPCTSPIHPPLKKVLKLYEWVQMGGGDEGGEHGHGGGHEAGGHGAAEDAHGHGGHGGHGTARKSDAHAHGAAAHGETHGNTDSTHGHTEEHVEGRRQTKHGSIMLSPHSTHTNGNSQRASDAHFVSNERLSVVVAESGNSTSSMGHSDSFSPLSSSASSSDLLGGEKRSRRTKDEWKAEKKRALLEDQHSLHEQEHMLKGFFNVVFFLFVMSSLIYSGVFIASYDPTKVVSKGTLINRYQYSQLTSLHVDNPILQDGITAISKNEAHIILTLYGYSGAGFSCLPSDVLSFTISGCSLTLSPQTCNDTSFLTFTPLETPEPTPSCEIDYHIQQGVVWSQQSSFAISFASTLQISASRFTYFQDAVDQTDPRCQPGNFSIGETNFEEVVTHPFQLNASLPMFMGHPQILPNYLQPVITREWTYGYVAMRYQSDTSSPPNYFTTLVQTVTSSGNTFPIFSPTSYAIDQSKSVTFQINQQFSPSFDMQVTERLIQPSEAFLTILLAIIGIFHVVHFAHEVFEISIVSWHSFKRKSIFAAMKMKENLLVAGDKFHASSPFHKKRVGAGSPLSSPLPSPRVSGKGKGLGLNQSLPMDENKDVNSTIGLGSIPIDDDGTLYYDNDVERGREMDLTKAKKINFSNPNRKSSQSAKLMDPNSLELSPLTTLNETQAAHVAHIHSRGMEQQHGDGQVRERLPTIEFSRQGSAELVRRDSNDHYGNGHNGYGNHHGSGHDSQEEKE